MKRIQWMGGMCIAFLGLPGAASAHHSFSMFDMSKPFTLEGTVKELQWTNPHIWVQLLVKDENGKDVEWSLQGGSPNMLTRYGWTRQVLKPGDRAKILVYPLRKSTVDAPIHGGALGTVTVSGQQVLTLQNPERAVTGEK